MVVGQLERLQIRSIVSRVFTFKVKKHTLPTSSNLVTMFYIGDDSDFGSEETCLLLTKAIQDDVEVEKRLVEDPAPDFNPENTKLALRHSSKVLENLNELAYPNPTDPDAAYRRTLDSFRLALHKDISFIKEEKPINVTYLFQWRPGKYILLRDSTHPTARVWFPPKEYFGHGLRARWLRFKLRDEYIQDWEPILKHGVHDALVYFSQVAVGIPVPTIESRIKDLYDLAVKNFIAWKKRIFNKN